MEKVLRTVTDCYGDETPVAVLTQKCGLLRLWEVTCWSSQDYNLGNCRCISHNSSEESPISTQEIIQCFGKKALAGFQTPGVEQIVFDSFGIEVNELETYIRVSYQLGINPLPALREKTTIPIIYCNNPETLSFSEKLKESILIVNSNGEISIEIV